MAGRSRRPALRIPFTELPGASGPLIRPVLPVAVDGIEGAPLACLVDTGAVGNRMGVEIAEAAAISLDHPLDRDTIVVGGITSTGSCVRVDVDVAGTRLELPVWFCDPWPFGFGLLGQEGFLRYFRVTLCAAEGWLECVPETA